MNNLADSRMATKQSINRLIEKSKNARRAFTLVEMLIVVAILATLMTIVFRLGGVGDQDARRATTLAKLQKVENCLSGYYAAFGSYPPVRLHGSQDFRREVDSGGNQVYAGGSGDQELNNDAGDGLAWAQVEAACRAQPFGCEYPSDTEDDKVIDDWVSELQYRVSSDDYPEYKKSPYADVFKEGFSGLKNLNGFPTGSIKSNYNWRVVKLFKFGMMSFLLPRYLFMLNGAIDSMKGGEKDIEGIVNFAQWRGNNDLPSDPFLGSQFASWDDIMGYVDRGGSSANDLARIANIPSQAVCARWMPNLEHTCRALRQMSFFGIEIADSVGLWLDDEYPPNPDVRYSPEGDVYKNAFVTMNDGWGREFYYYSPSPYQSYVVWSAGPNGKTFPPWVALDEKSPLDSDEKKTAVKWKKDDVMQMSH